MVQRPISVGEIRARGDRLLAVDHPPASIGSEVACASRAAVERVVRALVIAEPAVIADKATVVVGIRPRAGLETSLGLVPEGNVPMRASVLGAYCRVRAHVPCTEHLHRACVVIVHGMVQALVLDVAHIVPLVSGKLGAEPVHQSLLRSGREHEVRGGRVALLRTVLEVVGGEEEREYGINDTDGTVDGVAECASGGCDCTVLNDNAHD